MNKDSSLPLIGFFPLFENLSETGRAVKVAKRYIELGGKAVFFSHGGKYEYIVKEIGCEIIQARPRISEELLDDIIKYSRLEKIKNPLTFEMVDEHIKGELEAFKKSNVKMIVSTNNFFSIISARLAKIPYINIAPKVKSKFSKFPYDADFLFLKIFPRFIKLRILNWYLPKTKWMSKPLCKVAKKYNLKKYKNMSDYDLVKGDYTFYTDALEFLDIKSSDVSKNEFYIGPILLDDIFKEKESFESTGLEKDIENHFKKPGKNILVTLGSSGKKETLLKIINALNETKYNVLVIYTSVLNENNLPKVNTNILLKKFVLKISEIHKKVDLSIIHGGQGTVYATAYAGKPAVGIPMTLEQHLNLENLERENMALILSNKYFNKTIFINSMKKIFENYDFYLSNAEKFSKKIPKVNGEKNAVELILKIIKSEI